MYIQVGLSVTLPRANTAAFQYRGDREDGEIWDIEARLKR
jgi:hypothetical protein